MILVARSCNNDIGVFSQGEKSLAMILGRTLYITLELQVRYEPMVSVRRFQQVLNADSNLNWQRMHSAHALFAVHREARMVSVRGIFKREGGFGVGSSSAMKEGSRWMAQID